MVDLLLLLLLFIYFCVWRCCGVPFRNPCLNNHCNFSPSFLLFDFVLCVVFFLLFIHSHIFYSFVRSFVRSFALRSLAFFVLAVKQQFYVLFALSHFFFECIAIVFVLRRVEYASPLLFRSSDVSASLFSISFYRFVLNVFWFLHKR